MMQKSQNKIITPAIWGKHAADQPVEPRSDRSIAGIQGLVWLFTMAMSFFLSTGALAEDQPRVNPYSGDSWSRSTLTGDWSGVRNNLAKKGVTFDLSLTQVYQGIVGGGKDELWKYGGRGDLTINVDTQKLGLWPGGSSRWKLRGMIASQ